MWCLLRVFPFIISGYINDEEDRNHMNLILLLLRIMEIIFALKLTKSLMPYLRALIIEFINLFRELFPEKNLINKIHHMMHYPECIEYSGPLLKQWCMGFERKHGPMKQRAQAVNNFKNAPKTLIKICQSAQSAMWGAGDLKLHSIKCQGGKSTQIEYTLSSTELRDIGYSSNDIVFKTRCVKENGAKYAIGLFVCLHAKQERNVNLPLFGKISEIIVVQESKVFLKVIVCSTLHLDDEVNAFSIEFDEIDCSTFICTSELAHYRCFSAWKKSTSEELFISFRHILL